MKHADVGLMVFRTLKASDGIGATVFDDNANELSRPTIVLARTDSVATTSREVTYEADRQDIFVEKADLSREPVSGDRFIYEQAGERITAEAKPLSDNEPCMRRWYGGQVYRVHCVIRSRE